MEDINKFGSESQAGTGEILLDLSKSGRKRDWKQYKLQSFAVSTAYLLYEELKCYGEKIASCGSYLRFGNCPNCLNGQLKLLIEAYFCRCRLCVMCQWRKSLLIFHQVLALIHAHKKQYVSDIPLLLTLTVPNISDDKLSITLKRMQKSWDKLAKRAKFKDAIRSWFRALEVTYNREKDTYHPHYHILLLVPKGYFERSLNLYISRDEWLNLWQRATGLVEITQVDIRRVRKQSKRKPLEAVAAEVAKYATKPSSYIEKNQDGSFVASEKAINALHYALKGRRLVAFGGLFKRLRKDLKQKDIEKANLVKITEEVSACHCTICQSSLVDEVYRWHIGVKEYIG